MFSNINNFRIQPHDTADDFLTRRPSPDTTKDADCESLHLPGRDLLQAHRTSHTQACVTHTSMYSYKHKPRSVSWSRYLLAASSLSQQGALTLSWDPAQEGCSSYQNHTLTQLHPAQGGGMCTQSARTDSSALSQQLLFLGSKIRGQERIHLQS